METLSFNSNESTLATTIKNTIYVEANVMKIYESFSFIPLMASEKKLHGFRGDVVFKNLAFRLPWQPIKISDLDKIHMVGKGLLQKHFCKTFFKTSSVTQK